MRSKSVKKDNPFWIGAILGPSIHSLAYILRDATGNIPKDYSDFDGMEKAGLKKEITYPILLGISALQSYRLLKNPDAKKKLKFWVNPRPDKVAAGFTYDF